MLHFCRIPRRGETDKASRSRINSQWAAIRSVSSSRASSLPALPALPPAACDTRSDSSRPKASRTRSHPVAPAPPWAAGTRRAHCGRGYAYLAARVSDSHFSSLLQRRALLAEGREYSTMVAVSILLLFFYKKKLLK